MGQQYLRLLASLPDDRRIKAISEHLPRAVSVNGFWISETPCTGELWSLVMRTPPVAEQGRYATGMNRWEARGFSICFGLHDGRLHDETTRA